MIKAVIFDYGSVLRRWPLLQPELFDLAAELRDKGIKTAVLSNMITPLVWIIKLLGDLKNFDPVVFSSEIGASKPDTKAYQAVLDKLDLKPGECLFVDNLSENIEAAQKLGLKTVLAQNTSQTAADIKEQLSFLN